MNKALKRTIPIILAIVGLLSAVTGLLQFFGITHLPIISDIVHPPAGQILAAAKSAEFTDMTCSINAYSELDDTSGPLVSVTVAGTCGLTKNPERAIVQANWQWSDTFLHSSEQKDIYDVSTNTQYSSSDNGSTWTTQTIQGDCVAGQMCVASGLIAGVASLHELYDITDVQFIGVQSINNESSYHIRGDRSDGNDAVTVDLWILQDTYLPAQATEQYTSSIAGGAGHLWGHQTLNFADYDQGITIPLPSR